MAVTHTTAVRSSLADAFVAAIGASAKCKFYTGTPPANAQAALSGNTLAATITGITFGAASSGVSTITASTSDTNATGGVVTFARFTTSADVVVAQCSVTATGGGGDITMASTTIPAGAIVAFSGSPTYTAPS